MRKLHAAALAISAVPIMGFQPLSTTTVDDLQSLSDEFNDSSSLTDWNRHALVEGWPDQAHTLDVDQSTPGALHLEPEVSGWFQDYRGVFLYKEISGDFLVTTRIRVTGLATDLPTRDFSLAGLMVRAPRTPGPWQYGQEDWLFIATGRGNSYSTPQIERKTTIDSVSNLVLSPAQGGWVDLRIVRRGSVFNLYRRFEGESWQLHWTYDRPDLPTTLHVGMQAYTDWPTVSAFPDPLVFNSTVIESPPGTRDLIARYDYVRFRRPRANSTS